MATPAQATRARRDPAIFTPPKPPTGDRETALKQLRVVIGGQPYTIGSAVEGDPAMDAAKDSAATVTIQVRDPDGNLERALSDPSLMMAGAVTITINTIVYTLQSATNDGTGLVTLTFEDQVAWRLRQFIKPLKVKRSESTRAQFVARLVDEASRPPLETMRFFCPEINDRQRIAAPTPD